MVFRMTGGRVLTHLSFPVAVSAPSPRNIQWSEDGQLFILSRNAIHILTPEFNADLTLFSVHDPRLSSKSSKDIEWFTNRIEIDKGLHHNWAVNSDDWGALSLGSLDVSWVGMALSPTNSSTTYCCVLAALTSNLEISLWGPFKNHISGEWQKIQDVTQTIKDSVASLDNGVQGVQTAQVQCMAWSKGIHIVSVEGTFHGSILALGNRAGSIICMEYSRENGLSYSGNIQVAKNWIIDMVWSSWSQQEDNCQSASIFCSAADGSIYEVQLKVYVHSQSLRIKFSDVVELLHPADFTPTITLSLIQHQTHGLVLFYTKPGVVNLRKITRDVRSTGDNFAVLALPIQSFLHKQDPFAAIAGIVYHENEDNLKIHASDGTVYEVSNVTDLPKISIDEQFLELRDEIEIFKVPKEELDKVTVDERIYISGIINADHAGIFGWFYECRRPNDFSYKLDSQHVSFFSLAQLQGLGRPLNEHLSNYLSTANDTVAYYPMPRKLRETLIHLNHSLVANDEINRIWELFQNIPIQRYLDVQPSSFSKNTQNSSFPKLFQDPQFSLLRFRLTVVNCLLSCDLKHLPVREYLDQLAQSINCSYMQIVLRQLQSLGSYKDGDEDFMLRWLVLCHTKGDILQREAAAAAATMGLQEEISSRNTKICESCPACHAIIPADFEDEAVCENGHRWQRCSITSFILATPNVRTCVGCRRKSVLPPSLKLPSDIEDQDLLPPMARSGFVNDLLEAVHWCVYCENRFVRLL